MPVLGIHSYALSIPDVDAGIEFYRSAGLIATQAYGYASLRCPDQARDCVTLVAAEGDKRMHHVALRASGLDDIACNVPKYGGRIISPPDGPWSDGLWIEDPHGMVIRLVECPADPDSEAGLPFEINAPGRIVRSGKSAMLSGDAYEPARPLRLGHVLVFTPDVLASVEFVTRALGMRLADRAQDVIAFTCARRDSDHHVLAFAKSPGIGFHHASFQLGDPDDVGRAGRALSDKIARGDWGFGRHTIGSNFFHYIKDPWGSWFEYYADMDFIEDHDLWQATNYEMADSLANWGPAVPFDFVHNYEAE
ncbi:VOC family protein [Novosphingobium sp. RL4]|uniref:VOC family protein n=1 Tax=Novosphingobium sp. RL4 TaxID=3109595 RepID=UPI002D79C1E3|nr:VOC family protein [Novosphingobium sp. RL4]WRT94437.1 VOC family protein [Novosphingobium sp. RL4]